MLAPSLRLVALLCDFSEMAEEFQAITGCDPAEAGQFLEMSGGHNDGFIVSGSAYIQGLEAFINKHL